MTTRVFTADGSELQTANPVLASMYRNAAQNITTGAMVLVQLDSTQYSAGHASCALVPSTSGYRITATIPGYYRVFACATFAFGAGVAAASYCTIHVSITGVAMPGQAVAPAVSSSYAAPQLSKICYLSAGDYVQLYMEQTTGATIATMTDPANRPRLDVELIR